MSLISFRHLITPFTDRRNLISILLVLLFFLGFRVAGARLGARVIHPTSAVPARSEIVDDSQGAVSESLVNDMLATTPKKEASPTSSSSDGLSEIEQRLGIR